MPTQYLTQVAQSPADRVIGDIPLKTLAGLELSRRAQMQNELAAMNAPNPQMPTVLDATVQSLSPQPQQPMPQPGMMPPQQPMPQQAAPQPQPQPQQPPQPQQQQQPPQAKQPPIMGLPSMQGPKKMAGGGIIAFNGEKDSEVPTPSPYAGWENLVLGSDKKQPENKDFSPFVDPRAYPRPPKEEKKVPPAVKDDAKKPDSNLPIQKVPDPEGGIAAFMKMFGGMGGGGGGGGGGSSKADSETRKRLADIVTTDSPEQQAFRASALKRSQELENFKTPQLSAAERRKFIDEEFGRNQAYSKPHFDMMQKMIDEEREANNAGKESEVYKMLGKMGGALMSSRGAFGPALGRAVGEGIDYSDKVDAARAAAERLRRQAQMDLVKARMLDEKGDRQSALAALAEHDKALQAASKLEMDVRLASTNLLKDVAASDSRKQIEALKLGNQLDMSEQRAAARAQNAGLTNQLGIARLMMQFQQGQDRNRPTMMERINADKRTDEVFANPNSATAIKFIAMTPTGENVLESIRQGSMKPTDPRYLKAVQDAQELYKQYLSKGTRSSSGGSSIPSIGEVNSQYGVQ
jgi:hypothetical protein